MTAGTGDPHCRRACGETSFVVSVLSAGTVGVGGMEGAVLPTGVPALAGSKNE